MARQYDMKSDFGAKLDEYTDIFFGAHMALVRMRRAARAHPHFASWHRFVWRHDRGALARVEHPRSTSPALTHPVFGKCLVNAPNARWGERAEAPP